MKKRNSKPTVAVVGAGNVAAALGPALHRAGYRIVEVVVRDRPESRRRGAALAKRWKCRMAVRNQARLDAKVVLLAVTDDAIASTASEIARHVDWSGKVVLHLSGARSARDLNAVKRRGAAVGSFHLMNTFVRGVQPRLEGTFVAVEGDQKAVALAETIAKDIHCQPFQVRSDDKVLYHAMGAFASPLLVALLTVAEGVGREAGVKDPRRVLGKLLIQTITNYRRKGPAAAFSGPINRGDVATIKRHLKALRGIEEAGELYRLLGRSALRKLPVKSKNALKKLL